MSQATQLVNSGASSSRRASGDSCETQLASSSYHGSAFSRPLACPVLPQGRRGQAGKSQVQVTLQGCREDPAPTPEVSRALVCALQPLGQWGLAKPWLQRLTPPMPTHLQHIYTHSVHTPLLELPGATAVTCRRSSSLCNPCREHLCRWVRRNNPAHTCPHDTPAFPPRTYIFLHPLSHAVY